MKTPDNPFKLALSRGDLQLGLWVALADAYTAEVVANAGYDWLVLDGEHTPHDLRSLLHSLQAVAAYASHPVVRLPHGEAALIKQVLEIGAQSLLVPMVETVSQARDLVSAMRYPPAGIRGVGAPIARSGRFGDYEDYFSRANETVCLVVQIESATAAANAVEIAAVDGVDGIFIGPADLAASMGLLGQPTHPSVRALIEQTVRAVRASGKSAGVYTSDETVAQAYQAAGANLLTLGADVSLLARASRQLLQRYRGSAAATAASGY